MAGIQNFSFENLRQLETYEIRVQVTFMVTLKQMLILPSNFGGSSL